MKIGIFGNTNNYPLLLASGLRELGVHVVLVVNRTEPLHRPESKYPQFAAGYPDWIVDGSRIPEDDYLAGAPRVGEVLNRLAIGCDGLVLNHLGPSLLEFARRPAVALMTGSDLTYYANRSTTFVRQQGWAADYLGSPGARLTVRRWDEFVERQRAGIAAARAVSAPLPGLVPELDTLLDGIGVPHHRRDFFYIADTASSVRRARRAGGPLRVVNGARLNWRRPLPPGYSTLDLKGTDVLLHGFARFARSGGDAELVMFRKGVDAAATEALALELGIADRILWREEVTLSEFYDEIARADIVCDQLGESFPGLVALDAMALGLPVIANFHPHIIGAHYPERMPVCQATTAAEVAAHLDALAGSEAGRVRLGLEARRFARTWLSPRASAQRCLRHLGLAPD